MRATTSVLCWSLAAAAVLGVGLRALGLDAGPLVPAYAFYPYLVAAGAVALAVPVLARRRTPAIVMAVALLLGTIPLVPRALGGDVAGGATAPDDLAVATLNTLYGRADPAQVVAIARSVDVLALQEVTEDGLAALRGAGLDDELPHHTVDLRSGAGGSGVWSRHPLELVDVLDSRFAMLHVVVRPPAGEPVDLVAAHPVPPSGRAHIDAWRSELDLLADLPAVDVLLGDLNATYDHAAFRDVLAAGYVDAADALGLGYRATWPAREFPLPGIVIDHVLVGERWAPTSLAVVEVAGSDHRAVVATLRSRDRPPATGSGPSPPPGG